MVQNQESALYLNQTWRGGFLRTIITWPGFQSQLSKSDIELDIDT